MKEIGLGLIGLGSMGATHLRHGLKLQNARLVAVADVSKKALDKARRNGVKKTYHDYEELLRDSEVDAVIIALPTHLHLQCATNSAEAGKDIFLEKPVARNVQEGNDLVSSARKNSVKLMIGYPLRFNPIYRDLRERINTGELGEIETAYAVNIGAGPFVSRAETYIPTPVPDWWFSRELTGGGVLMDLGCHMINLLRWYFGEITDIRSHLGYRFNLDLEDSAICCARFGSGTRAIVNVGWFSQSFQLRVELAGTVENFIAEDIPSNPLSSVVYRLTRKTPRFSWPYFVELQYFANCVANDLNPSPSGEDGLQDLAAISLAYKNQTTLN